MADTIRGTLLQVTERIGTNGQPMSISKPMNWHQLKMTRYAFLTRNRDLDGDDVIDDDELAGTRVPRINM